MLSKNFTLLICAGLVLLAAAIFLGTVIWHDSNTHVVMQQSQATSDNPTVAAEGTTPHYSMGMLRGSVTAVSGANVTLALEDPNDPAHLKKPVIETIIIDSDTKVYTGGHFIQSTVYEQDLLAFKAAGSKGIPPDPFEHVDASVSAIRTSKVLNVYPKEGGVSGNTVHALGILVMDPLPAPAQ